MLNLIRSEIYKVFKKWRTYISFITIGALTVVVEIALLIEGKHYVEYATRNLGETFLFVGNFLNGYLIAHIVLNTLTIHIPFLITLVAGDLLAGEATAGTYRVLLTRPVSRFNVVLAKFIAGMTYSLLLVFFLAVVSLGLGIILFGTGELLVFKGGLIIFNADDILWRFLIAYCFAGLSMSVVMSIAFFFSSLVENAIGPIIATMALIIVFLILSNLDIGFLKYIRPYLFTNYMGEWNSVFDYPVEWLEIGKSSLILFCHLVGFFLMTFLLFRKKDILT